MYKINGNNVIRLTDGAHIPNHLGNTDYQAYLIWLAEGNTPEPEFSEADALALASVAARELRDAELTRADIMLNRVQDGETGIGTQKAWRAYRVSLRDWPSTESFPLDAPVAPDAK
jgi:hypothetical protein